MTETETKWAERVREWRESGKEAQEFAAGRTYKASTLRWWATELRRRGEGGGRRAQARTRTGGTTGTIAMARVVMRGRPRKSAVTDAPAATGDLVVEISGARIAVSRGFDAGLLTEVVRALAGAR